MALDYGFQCSYLEVFYEKSDEVGPYDDQADNSGPYVYYKPQK